MPEFRDNQERHRFELEIDGHIAFVSYRRSPDAIKLIHTEVPKELGGRGIGSDLARRVFDSIKAEGVKAVVTCPFLVSWMQRHPEYDGLLLDSPSRL